MGRPYNLETRDLGEVFLVKLAGRLDHESVAGLQEAMAATIESCAERGAGMVVDMGAVDYISSIGLRMLFSAARSVKNGGGELVLTSLRPSVAEILSISGLDRRIPVKPDRDAAVRELSTDAATRLAASNG
ncbi:MAG: STAS domain-containing protein [Geminicoccaceae bacterium]